jgi:lipopolysaccharide transport system ATP-binding protein
LFSSASQAKSVIQEIQNSKDLDGNIDFAPKNDRKEEAPKRKAYFIKDMQSKSLGYYESKGSEITEPAVMTLEGEAVNVLCKGDSYNYSYKVAFTQDCPRVRFGMLIKTITGIEVGGFATSTIQNPIELVLNGSQYHVTFSFVCRLNPGVYFLNAGAKGVDRGEEVYLHRILDAVMIRVMPEEDQQSTGIVDFEIEAQVLAL